MFFLFGLRIGKYPIPTAVNEEIFTLFEAPWKAFPVMKSIDFCRGAKRRCENQPVPSSSFFLLVPFLRLLLLDPLRTLLRMFLRLLLTHVLHAMRTRHVPSFLHPRPHQHPVVPRLQMWELIDIDARPSSRCDPTPVRDVRYCALVSYQIAG